MTPRSVRRMRFFTPPNGWPLSCGRALMLPRLVSSTAARAAEARGRQLQRLVRRPHAPLHRWEVESEETPRNFEALLLRQTRKAHGIGFDLEELRGQLIRRGVPPNHRVEGPDVAVVLVVDCMSDADRIPVCVEHRPHAFLDCEPRDPGGLDANEIAAFDDADKFRVRSTERRRHALRANIALSLPDPDPEMTRRTGADYNDFDSSLTHRVPGSAAV